MKKIFKSMAILAATAAVGAGVGVAAGCNVGTNGTYYGEYHYLGEHGVVYGFVAEVTVENNIIKSVKNLTNSNNEYAKKVQEGKTWAFVSGVGYGWTEDNLNNWEDHEKWLMQQYNNWSVADILAIPVYTDYAYTPALDADGNPIMGEYGPTYKQDFNTMGEPCKADWNKDLVESGLLISEATQGSGRVLLAVQNALNNK